MIKNLILIVVFFLFNTQLYSQNQLYNFSDLSSKKYKSFSDSILKQTCPQKTDQQKVQKNFCEKWKTRYTYIKEAIQEDQFVYEPNIYNLLDEIVSEIYAKNKALIVKKPFILVDRSSVINAYSIGGDIIIVNLGLIEFCSSKEELALTIAHEIAHNNLQHCDKSMLKTAEWLNSEEYELFLKDLRNDKYNRLTKLINKASEYTFNRNKHNRFGELEADSLAVKYLSNTKYDFDASNFLRLDSADRFYRKNLLNATKSYFENYGITVNNEWINKKLSGLSSRKVFVEDTTALSDTLKTHPDCVQRYQTLKVFSKQNPKHTVIEKELMVKVKKMLIWSLYNKGYLAGAIYRLMLLEDEGVKDNWTQFMFVNSLLSLYYYDATFSRSNAISVLSKQYISSSYYQLQTLLEQIPHEGVEQVVQQAVKYAVTLSDNEKKFREMLLDINKDPQGFKFSKTKLKEFYDATTENDIYKEFFK